MERERLIKLIERGLRLEEELSPTLTKNISAAINFLEKDEKIRKKVLDVMTKLGSESEGHAKKLRQVLKIVTKRVQDVY